MRKSIDIKIRPWSADRKWGQRCKRWFTKKPIRDSGQFSKENILKFYILKSKLCQQIYNYLRCLCYIVVLMC